MLVFMATARNPSEHHLRLEEWLTQHLARHGHTEFFFCLVFRDMVCLCISGYPRNFSVDQAGLEFPKILLPMPPECLD